VTSIFSSSKKGLKKFWSLLSRLCLEPPPALTTKLRPGTPLQRSCLVKTYSPHINAATLFRACLIKASLKFEPLLRRYSVARDLNQPDFIRCALIVICIVEMGQYMSRPIAIGGLDMMSASMWQPYLNRYFISMTLFPNDFCTVVMDRQTRWHNFISFVVFWPLAFQ